MKKIVLALGIVVLTANAAHASGGTISWTGNGSDNLPCSNGGHWVLAPAFGIISATLTVDGTDYVMTQNGNGSWSADSVGPLDDPNAYVTYTGDGDERDHLQLSHCTEGGSPSPSASPTPTESPSPSSTLSPSSSSSQSTSSLPTRTESDPSPTTTNTGSSLASTSVPRTATTGLPKMPLILGSVLLSLGLGATIVARRRSA